MVGIQPLDAGIIKTFNVQYHQFLMRSLILMDGIQELSDMLKADMLRPIKWIVKSWKGIQFSTISVFWKTCLTRQIMSQICKRR
jgi:DDE superfamily endonuclease